ncbi:MAG: hypothetical protein FJ362_01980 [Gemmatimonadetes bacterium]|nr:hypothetical protein [Gemmatimonadota bacterium]
MAKVTITQVQLMQRLQAALADDLVAVVLYGSAARPAGTTGSVTNGAATTGGAAPSGARNILVLVRTLTPSTLRSVARTTHEWIAAGHPAPLIMTEGEWRTSRDIFAIEVADILERHEVLVGALPAGVAGVDSAHLRHQLEFETMGKLLAIRQGILAADGDPARELQLLAATKSAVLVLFRTLLRLHGEPIPADAAEVVRHAAARVGFDPVPFLRVLAHVAGTAAIPTAEADSTLTGYHQGIERFVSYVDAGV